MYCSHSYANATTEHTIDLTDDTNPIAGLVLNLEHVQSALESGTRLLHCVEYKTVKWGDYTVKDNRFSHSSRMMFCVWLLCFRCGKLQESI